MPLPNFFVIGAAKSGTTALWQALGQHPDIYMSPVKEPLYFSREAPAGSTNHLDRVTVNYLRLFDSVNGQRAIGECSNRYLASAIAARQIRRNIPDAKLVALLRHPVERAHSNYWHEVLAGREDAPSFEQALAAEPARLAADQQPWRWYRARGHTENDDVQRESRKPKQPWVTPTFDTVAMKDAATGAHGPGPNPDFLNSYS